MHKTSEIASSFKAASNRTSLQERLRARHENALATFRESMKCLHEGVDSAQKAVAMRLKQELDKSHAKTTTILSTEKHKAQEHEEMLDKHAELCENSSDDCVFPPFEDKFFRATDIDYEPSMERMKAERYRLLGQAVDLQKQFSARMALIQGCASELAEHEAQRKNAVQVALRDVMLSLAKISYCNVTVSHVLAQRELHCVNKTIAANYEGIQTLFAQLSCRELLKQERHTTTMAEIYHQVLRCMGKSSAYWLRTLLQSKHFRRPAERVECISRIAGLTASAHNDGVQFLDNLSVMIDSLKHAAKPPVGAKEEEYQCCGGSTSTGWLRHYRGETSSGPVPIQSCAEVVDEWRMKASVVVRNNSARCVELSDRTRLMEDARVGAVEDLNRRLFNILEWLHAPMEGEVDLLRLASMLETIPEGSKQNVDALFVKDEYKPLTSTRAKQAAELQTAYGRLLEPLVGTVRTEALWFATVVSNRLNKKQHVFEQTLLRASTSVLQWFEKASDALVDTTKGVVGCLREFYQKCHETRMWYNNELEQMELQLTALHDRLVKAESKQEAEKLFSEALNCLEQIAQRHIHFHNEVILYMDQATDSVGKSTNLHCGTMLDKISVESVEDTEARLAREHQAKVDSIMAMLALQEQQQKGKRGNRKGAEEISNLLAMEPMGEVSIPMEVVNYPQLTAQSGEVYNIIAPMKLIQQLGYDGDTAFKLSLADEPTSVFAEFVSCYNSLFGGSIESGVDSFISEEHDVTRWKEDLRRGLLNWTLALRTYTMENIKAFCQRARADQSIETAELLRFHRRRPAALQVQVYEARVRQLEDNANVAMKYGVRLRERVAPVLCVYEEFDKNEVWAAEDKQVLAQLKEMEMHALKAPNASALRSRERQYKAVCAQYMSCMDHRTEVLIDRVKTTTSSLTLELNQFQTFHSSHLSDGGKEAVEQIHAVLKELNETEASVRRHAETQREQRLGTIRAMQASYDAAHTRTTAELELIARLQEHASRFRAQIQSFISGSKATEDALNHTLELLDTSRQRVPPKPDLAAAILARTRLDGPIVASAAPPPPPSSSSLSSLSLSLSQEGAAGGAGSLPPAETLVGRLEQELQAARRGAHRLGRVGPPAELLRAVDHLRERLYRRGVLLQALRGGVELLVVDAAHYVEGRPGGESPSQAHSATGAGERPGSSLTGAARRAGRGGKPLSTAHYAAMVPEQQSLPAAASALTQFEGWAMAFRTAAMTAARAHFGTYPTPLQHPLPHLLLEALLTSSEVAGSLEVVERAVFSLIRVQETQIRDHVREALRVYRQQVQLVYNVVQALPQWLSASVYSISSTAVSLHVQSVLERFEAFYRSSEALRVANEQKMKVVLGAQSRKDVFQRLIASESARQALATEVTARFWGFALRGIQEEAKEHVARCYTSSNTLVSLLRGLVGPAHLVALGEGEVAEGHHRGLKSLKQLKAKNTQAVLQNELLGNASSNNREVRLQDGSSSGKQDSTNTRRNISVASKERGHNNNLDGTNAGSKPLIPITYAMVELLGLPTAQVRPLEAFNAEHSEWAVASPASGAAFPHSAPVEEAVPASTSGGGGGGGSRTAGGTRKMAQSEQTVAAPPAIPRTSPFIVPDTRLYQETIALAHKSVEELNTAVQEIVQHINKAFHGWMQREARYKQNWELSVNALHHTSARRSSLSSNAGISPIENDNTE